LWNPPFFREWKKADKKVASGKEDISRLVGRRQKRRREKGTGGIKADQFQTEIKRHHKPHSFSIM